MKLANFSIACCLLAGSTVTAAADVVLPSFIADHAVLQKSPITPIWGKADPGEAVSVRINSLKAKTQAGPNGKWRVTLNLQNENPGPHQLIVEGKNRIVLSDILVGEVWVCSGQSNMEFGLGQSLDASAEMSSCQNPYLRHFKVKKAGTASPQDECGYECKWQSAVGKSAGEFTAVGYYFGKEIQRELQVPVGLIQSSVGGTPIEAWMSLEALDQDPDIKKTKDQRMQEEADFPRLFEVYSTALSRWMERYHRTDRPANTEFASPSVSLTDWKPVNLPGFFAKSGLPDSGALWVRRQINISDGGNRQDLGLDLALIHDADTVYWNGVKVGESTAQMPGSIDVRRYMVPANLVKTGENTLAIRVFSPKGAAGIIMANTSFNAGAVALSGTWLAKSEFELPELDAETTAALPKAPDRLLPARSRPAHLFNAMVNPLLPAAIRGMIWYQGEANATHAWQYRIAFPLLIADWRSKWGRADLPFYFCQLANFGPRKQAPEESDWAELREAQSTALAMPNTGQAVLIDVGEEKDIHPRNKADVGNRLARIALAKTYGKPIAYRGPVYESMQIAGGEVRIRFQYAESGLIAKSIPETYQPRSSRPESVPLIRNSPESQVEGFAICGADYQWEWANASIEANDVVVWSPKVSTPVAVRYGWANNPICNLFNQEGLPAAPFRTDQCPSITIDAKY